MNGNIIFSYTRAQALEDGVLVDVTTRAREAGVKWPTAVTASVWAAYVEVPEGLAGQDQEGRLWDILWMFTRAALRGGSTDTILFRLLVQNDERGPEEVTLKAVIGPGDDPRPVITIMLPEED